MSKVEECWVIQRKDGYFYYDYEFIKKYPYEMKPRFTKDINKVFLNYNFWNKFGCEKEIKLEVNEKCDECNGKGGFEIVFETNSDVVKEPAACDNSNANQYYQDCIKNQYGDAGGLCPRRRGR